MGSRLLEEAIEELLWLNNQSSPDIPQAGFYARLQTSISDVRAGGSNTATFTRASTAYQIDFEAKHNLVLSGEARMQGARRVSNKVTVSSEVFNGAGWNSTNATRDAGGIFETTSNTTHTLQEITTDINLVAGHTYVVRAEVRGRGRTWMWSEIYGTTDYVAFFNLSGVGSVGTVTAATNAGISLVNDGSGYYLITYRATPAATGGSTGVYFAPAAADTVGVFVGDVTKGLDVRKVQVEEVTGQSNQNPGEYVSVGVLSAPYHGANVDGVKYFDTLPANSVTNNVVTEATGARIVAGASGVAATAPVDAGGPFGYLAEGARADVLGTTAAIRRTMTDVGWVVGATMTVGSATGTDGVASAGASLTGGAVTATNTILYTTVLGSAARTYSAWIRRKTGTGTIEMTDDGGANWTDITSTLTSAYKLFQVTRTQANPIVGFRITTNLDAIEVDFNTIEAAAFANPTPIPINVSKAADVPTYARTGNLSVTNGTFYGEAARAQDNSARLLGDSAGGAGAFYYTGTGPDVGNMYDGTNLAAATYTFSTAVHKYAGTWGGPMLASVVDGGTVATSAFTGSLDAVGVLEIGSGLAGGGSLFGTIRQVRIWNRALNSTTLQALTTP